MTNDVSEWGIRTSNWKYILKLEIHNGHQEVVWKCSLVAALDIVNHSKLFLHFIIIVILCVMKEILIILVEKKKVTCQFLPWCVLLYCMHTPAIISNCMNIKIIFSIKLEIKRRFPRWNSVFIDVTFLSQIPPSCRFAVSTVTSLQVVNTV
jgi:hypothetical protein